ncbi:MAG: glycosyl hydrolase 53 family protein, partial [Eubacterium sp.]
CTNNKKEDENLSDATSSESLVNADFETKDTTGWTVEDPDGVTLVRNDDWASENLTYFVKIQPEKDTTFNIYQTIKVDKAGTYTASVDYEGSETFAGKMYFKVLKEGEELASVDVTPSMGWDVWNTAYTEDIELEAGDEVTIGVYCALVGKDWGDIDNFEFYPSGEKPSEASDNTASFPEYDNLEEGGATGSGEINYKGVIYNDKSVNDGNWIKGIDISSILSVENSGIKFYNADGQEEDIFKIFADAGVNYVRVRVWNDPYLSTATEKTAETSYGGGVCDVDYCVEIAKRCKAVGIKLYVDFHYSDFWSDPGRSYAPKAWEGMNLDEKSEALSEFTTDSLKKIAATGVELGIVSVGNETNGYMAGESGLDNIAVLMKAGAEAIRAFDNNILIAVHFANPESYSYASAAAKLYEAGVDYDIFGSSYYPQWHGTLENLQQKLSSLAENYGKLTMIAEYSYSYQGSAESSLTSVFGDYTEEGQTNAIKVINSAAAEIKYCIGTFYWEPAWVTTPSDTWASCGSGWITANAAEYDKANSGIAVAQGSACADQSMFKNDGTPNDCIKTAVFNTIWKDE